MAFAAYNDVTLTKDVTYLTVGGKTIGIDTTNAAVASISVGASTFSFILEPGSSLKASSTGLYKLTSDAFPSNVVATVCDSSTSSIEFKNTTSGTGSATITVTPGDTLCEDAAAVVTTTGGAVSVSSSGGGGSSASTSAKPVTVTAQTTPTVQTTTSFSGVQFAKRLIKGSIGVDVTNLQKYLATDPTLYPEGLVTGTFGSLTLKAVQKFQEKYGIAKKGVIGYGEVGPATRAKLNALMGSAIATTPTTQTTSTATADALQAQIAALLKMVADLSAQLKAR